MISLNRPSHRIKSYDTSYAYIISCAEKSLKNLHTDYLDLFLVHRPDPLMNPNEIAEAFTSLIKDGKILSAGVSNFTVSQVDMLHAVFPVSVNQIEISVSMPDPFLNGQLDQCQRLNILPMAWAPLGGGTLFTNPDGRQLNVLQRAKEIAVKYITSVENVLLAFLHTHPAGIIPVLGTSKRERLSSAYDQSNLKLEKEEWFTLWEASAGKPVP
jgi:predicted oxidoreductase